MNYDARDTKALESNEKKFQMLRQSTCGNQIREVVERNLTLQECMNLEKYPSGVHDYNGGKWFYTHSLM